MLQPERLEIVPSYTFVATEHRSRPILAAATGNIALTANSCQKIMASRTGRYRCRHRSEDVVCVKLYAVWSGTMESQSLKAGAR